MPVPLELVRWQVMKAMGWTFEVYRSQPDWLIDEFLELENMQSEAENAKMKRAKMQ